MIASGSKVLDEEIGLRRSNQYAEVSRKKETKWTTDLISNNICFEKTKNCINSPKISISTNKKVDRKMVDNVKYNKKAVPLQKIPH